MVKPPSKARSLMGYIEFVESQQLPTLDRIFIVSADGSVELHENRKWARGRFEKSLGIDQPTSGVGQTHGHVYGRKGNETVVVNIDGTASHGTKGKLHAKDADALRALGFSIPTSNIVEWHTVGIGLTLLMEDGRQF